MWSAGCRKRKLYKFGKACMEKLVKALWVNLYSADSSYLEPLCPCLCLTYTLLGKLWCCSKTVNGDELLFKVDVQEKDGASQEKGELTRKKIPILNFVAPPSPPPPSGPYSCRRCHAAPGWILVQCKAFSPMSCTTFSETKRGFKIPL